MLVGALMGGLFWSAAAATTTRSEHPQLFGGTLVLEDVGRPLTVIDVATAKVTVRLDDVFAQVGGSSYGDVEAVAIDGGTMLVNRHNGTFNLLEKDNYVLDPYGPGVGLGPLAGLSGAEAVASGSDAYIVRSAPHSTVSLVDAATVAAAAKLEAASPAATGSSGSASGGHAVTAAPAEAVTPPGFAALSGQVALAPGSAVAGEGGDMWVLESVGTGCQVVQLHPVASGHNGLVVTKRLAETARCDQSAIESSGAQVAVAEPGRLTLYTPSGASGGLARQTVPAPATAGDTEFLPVTGADNGFWYLGRSASGWTLIGVSPVGRVGGPYRLGGLDQSADPVAPALANGFLYTLDQAQAGQPTLWAIDTVDGNMAPVRVAGADSYPTKSATEKASFEGSQVLMDGPRVVFNNPESLEAVVIFTDGSHQPVVVDKSDAIEVSATGPSDLNATTPTTTPGSKHHGGQVSSSAQTAPKAIPVIQPVSQQVTCAETTQKPYAPQITSITPSSGSALVTWSYQLLDQTDCEPDSWSVTMNALGGTPQPAVPTQTENGQSQYLFEGLRPATVYQVVVTAYINAQSTPSAPETFTTAARGPDAPLSVTTSSDGDGNWIVSWVPCTETANPNCVVPADLWTITGAACGSSFVGTPPTLQVAATGKNQVSIGADQLGLLGDSLSFSVQGALLSGLVGNPTSDNSCTEAWRPPNPSAITLSAAGIAAPGADSITATLQINTTVTPLEAFGSQNTEFVYSVGGITVGPTSRTTVTVPGLAAGQQYTPSVSIYPAGHQSASVTITGTPFTQDLSWPSDLGMAVTPSVDAANPNTGSLDVTFPNLPTGPMEASGNYTCGSQQGPGIPATPITGGSLTVPFGDLVDYGGACSLVLTVVDTANPNPYGVSSSPLTTGFNIGQQPGYTFTAELSPYCQQNFCGGRFNPSPVDIVISIGGNPTPPLAGGDWRFVSSDGSSDPGAAACNSSYSSPGTPTFPADFLLPADCTDAEVSNIAITVDYEYLGSLQTSSAGNAGGSPATTTTTTTSSTTSSSSSSTSSTTSTTVPCPTTTSSTSTSTTTTCSGPNAPAQPAPNVSRTSANGEPSDPLVRSTLAGALLGVPGLWALSGAFRIRRRVVSSRQAKKGSKS